jgi:pantetheine-phosphate adenylyltransferase
MTLDATPATAESQSAQPAELRVAVYAGSFDPITCGHLSVIERAARLFDRLIVLVAVNPTKRPLFTVAERLAMIRETSAPLANVSCASTAGLVVDSARASGARFLVRGIRDSMEVDGEIILANANHELAPEIATVFIPAEASLSAVSSSGLKQLIRTGGDVSRICPPSVARRLMDRLTSPHPTLQGAP